MHAFNLILDPRSFDSDRPRNHTPAHIKKLLEPLTSLQHASGIAMAIGSGSPLAVMVEIYGSTRLQRARSKLLASARAYPLAIYIPMDQIHAIEASSQALRAIDHLFATKNS